MSSLRHRLLTGTGANAFGMALTVGIQLASLPLFLARWDAAAYGVWLMVATLPAYLAMADVGMVTAAGNRMVMAYGAGRHDEANRVFHSAQAMVLAVGAALLAVASPLIWSIPLPAELAAEVQHDVRGALQCLLLGVVLSFFAGLCDQRFRATQRYALGTVAGNLVRLAEWSGWMVGLGLWGSYTAVAASGLIARALGTLALMRLASERESQLRWGLVHADRRLLRELLAPGMGFTAFQVSHAVGLQGFTLLVGALLGPASVAVFNTYRTLSRTAVQLSGLFSHALWPEFSRLKGEGALNQLGSLARRGALLTLVQAVLVAAALQLLAPWLLQWWTHGEIGWLPSVFFVFMVCAVIGAVSHVPRTLLMASNEHTALAAWSLVLAVAGLGAGWLMARHGLEAAALATALTESVLAVVTLTLAWTILMPARRTAGTTEAVS